MKDIRISIFVTTCVLLAFGLVMVYSSSAVYAYEKWQDAQFFLKRHLTFFLAGLVCMFIAMSLDLETVRKYAKPLLLLSAILLVMVLVPGFNRDVAGARRWLKLGAYSIQPSEFAKLAMLVYLSDFVARKGYLLKDFFRGYAPALCVLGAVTSLVLIEPDFGTSVAIFTVGITVLFVAGCRLRHLFTTMLLGMPFLFYIMLSAPYRKKRLLIFLNPWIDRQGTGFQIIQSFLAIGSGGLFGVGLGQSKQKLFYLPESHTDFIFSIIAEELGFMGAGCLLVLFGILIWQGMRAAFKVNDIFRKSLILGVVSMIAMECIINIGASTGSMPTKGLALPFISYGGTSLVMHMMAIGLLLNATREGID